MTRETLTEIEGPTIGQTFDLKDGHSYSIVVVEGIVRLEGKASVSPIARIERDGDLWRFTLLAASPLVQVLDIEQDRPRSWNDHPRGPFVDIEDSNLVSFSSAPGVLSQPTKWVFQREASLDQTWNMPSDGLFSESKGMLLTHRKTMVFKRSRDITTPGKVISPNPSEAWGLAERPYRRHIDHVFDLIEIDPKVALRRSRAILKSILREVFERRLGDPADRRVSDLLRDLEIGRALPWKVTGLCRVILEMTTVSVEPHFSGQSAPFSREAEVIHLNLLLLLEWHHSSRSGT